MPVRETLGSFLPMFLVPVAAYPSLVFGFVTLFIANYTLCCHKKSDLPRLIRFAVAPIGIAYFLDFGFGAYDSPSNSVSLGLCVVGLYGIMRMMETCFVSLLDEGPPRWVKWSRVEMNGNGKTGGVVVPSVKEEIIPLPRTFWGRMAYAFDLSTSLRGNSWFSGYHWDWCPPSLAPKPYIPVSNGAHTNGSSTSAPVSAGQDRMTFVYSKLLWVVGQFIIIDMFDTMNKSRSWHIHYPSTTSIQPQASLNHYPITSQAPLVQIPLSISVCALTLFAITTQYDLISASAVFLIHSDPANWPPMFDHPFDARSLADFWGRRWHMIFRRVFGRLARPFEWIIGPVHAVTTLATSASNPRTRCGPHQDARLRMIIQRTLRATLIFGFTTTLHVLLMYRLTLHPNALLIDDPIYEIHSYSTFDPEIFIFFLLQPFLLLMEYVFIKPLFTRFLFPSSPYLASNAIRAWAWCALIWTGRYWSDVWVSRGLWMEREKVIGFSLLRGIWSGRWLV